MNRRSFLRTLGTAAAGAAVGAQVVDLERLTWVPGAKSFFFPWTRRLVDRDLGISIRFINQWEQQRKWNGVVNMANESLFNPASNIAESYRKAFVDEIDRRALEKVYGDLVPRLDVLYGFGSIDPGRMVRVAYEPPQMIVERIEPLTFHKDAYALVMDALDETPKPDLSNVQGLIYGPTEVSHVEYQKRFAVRPPAKSGEL